MTGLPVAGAAERAYQAIRAGILGGEHAPGSMLGEEALAGRIGVSRTPVRAALVRLQDEGWITVYPKRGALVRGVDDRMVTELAQARLVLESSAVQLASAPDRSALAQQLTAGIEAQREALAASDLRGFVELTVAFHRSFVEVAGNRVLLELNDRLADRQRFLLISLGEQLLGRAEATVAEHLRLVATLAEPAAFVGELRAHLVGTHGADLPRLLSAL